MRPDDRYGRWQPVDGTGSEGPAEGFGPLDADLESLDDELADAGRGARRALHGQTQPTRFFSNRLRDRLLATYPIAAAPEAAAAQGLPQAIAPGQARRTVVRSELTAPGEAWAPVTLEPQITRRTAAFPPGRARLLPGRARWAVLAAATLTGAIAAGALGARLDWLLPAPSATPSMPVTVVDATARPTSGPTTDPTSAPLSEPTAGPTEPAVISVPSAEPSERPDATPSRTKPPATEKPAPTATPKPDPTPKPTPKPTSKPEPTKPPVGSMDLMAKACPGGVLLDWTKPSADVGHYHTLRKLGGDVPASYPADGATEVETATSFGAGTTDGFDTTVSGGDGASYRAFAFDGEDRVMAYSPSRTVTTVGRISMGALTAEATGPGSMTFGWAAADVNAACFTYGKLVASQDDPDPSYLKGSSYIAVIDSPGATGVHLDGLPSGKTFWVRYEIVRVTSLGKFVVARTDVAEVTIP